MCKALHSPGRGSDAFLFNLAPVFKDLIVLNVNQTNGSCFKRIEMFGRAGAGKSTLYNNLRYDQLNVERFHSLKELAALKECEKRWPIFRLVRCLAGYDRRLGQFITNRATDWMNEQIKTSVVKGLFPFPDSALLPAAACLASSKKQQGLLNKIAWIEYIYKVRNEGLMVMDEGLVMRTDEKCIKNLPVSGLAGVVYVTCDFSDWYERMVKGRASGNLKGAREIGIRPVSAYQERYEKSQKVGETKCKVLESAGVPVLRVSTSKHASACVREVSEFITHVRG